MRSGAQAKGEREGERERDEGEQSKEIVTGKMKKVEHCDCGMAEGALCLGGAALLMQ